MEKPQPLPEDRSKRPLRTGGGPAGYVDQALKAAAEPFKGITTDGKVIPGLFRLERTGISTRTIRQAAQDFLSSLSHEQCTRIMFPVDTVEWRKWSNIHRTLIRHGLPLFEMSDIQRDCAFSLMRQCFSAEGFATARNVMRLNETVMEMRSIR